MEVHHHHTLQEKNGHIISGSFSCCSLLYSVDFLAENQLEHKIENDKRKVNTLQCLKI